MKRLAVVCLSAIVFAALCAAQTAPGEPAKPAPTQSESNQPNVDPVLPYSPSLDLRSMDTSVDPCVDFHEYACGGWKKLNPIPADQSSWSVYGKAYVDNLGYLRQLLELSARPDAKRSADDQKIGDFYSACMDEAAVEKAGVTPLKADLDAIAAVKNLKQLSSLVAQLHLTNVNGMFGFGSEQDAKDSNQVIAVVTQGGMGLPDRDYYTKEDPRSQEIRQKYVEHVARMFALLGDSAEQAKKNAETVMAIETALAKSALTRVERRDPYKIYHKMKVSELSGLAPLFDWKVYLRATKAPFLDSLNVAEPAFFKALQAELKTRPIDDWKTYLRWHLVDSNAQSLSKKFVDADFEFYRGYLRGVKEQQPRWKRCVQYVDNFLGESLGKVFVERNFSEQLKQDTLTMVKQIQGVMEQRINELDWMSPETKKAALVKLHAMKDKIGYPDKWRDYSALRVKRGDFAGNMQRAAIFEANRQLRKIGKPVDRGEWSLSPATVNAYYRPQMNDINFPAGVLQPPLYDAKMDAAPNYGNTGGTIGHELIHGFDDEGRQYDAEGNLRDWWTEEDARRYEERAACVANQYAQYTIIDDIKINSKLTLGEDIADVAGTVIAYQAWRNATQNQRLRPIDGLTPDQRFFIGFAQWDCADMTDAEKRVRALTDPHSPAKYRINGVVVNMPEFADAFGCKQGQPMVKKPEDVCKIW